VKNLEAQAFSGSPFYTNGNNSELQWCNQEWNMKFRVWGSIDGKAFDQVFASVSEWRAERGMIERVAGVIVKGMASV
jgi:hypothetical protein